MYIYKIIILCGLLLGSVGLKAQEAQCSIDRKLRADSTNRNRIITRATMYGVSFTNVFDTYLSPQEYKGIDFRISRESMRMTRLMDGNVSLQTFFQADLGNNPAQARAYINLAASGMAIWDLRIKNRPITLRYQVNLPLAGIMFMPNYGQTYYEIFTLGHGDGVVNFTSLHNQPSLRQMLTADFPVGRARMRFAYIWDAQQSKVNEIKTHTYSHVFMVGFVKELYLFPNKRK
mgnify:CR=1 FL=1